MAGLRHSRYVTIADQVVSSASNFALVVFIAHGSSASAFGQFSLGYAVLIFFLGLQRALIGEVLIVRFSRPEDRRPGLDAAVTGLATMVGLPSILIFVIGAVTVGRSDPYIWLLLGVCTLVVFVQDTLRYVFIARGHSGFALLIDVIWIAVAMGPMAWLAVDSAGPETITAAWGGGALVAAIVGFRLARVVPRPLAGMRWFQENRALSVRYSAEFAAVNASNTVVWFVLTPFLTTVGIAAQRGAMLLFSPLNTLISSMYLAVLPELVRAQDAARYRKRLTEAAFLVGVICLVWSAVVVLLPDSIGELILGESWKVAATVRIPFAVQSLSVAAFTLVRAHFRASQLLVQGTRLRIVLAVLTLVLPCSLAVVLGDVGAAWGFAAAVAISALAGVVVAIVTRRRPTDPEATPDVKVTGTTESTAA